MEAKVEQVSKANADVMTYFEKDLVRNSQEIWNLKRNSEEYELYVSRIGGEIKAHLGIYHSPEAIYMSLGGQFEAAGSLLSLVKQKGVLTTLPSLRELVASRLSYDAIFPNDLMLVKRGEEMLRGADLAVRLSSKEGVEYSSFGASFGVPTLALDWIQHYLDEHIVFGIFAEGKLASVATVAVWLPQVALIMNVETKKEFRRRGFGAGVVAASVREALGRSESCSLFVRSDNEAALALYRSLGFKKIGEDLYFDLGTGLNP
jgi:ribosomal protein S18 acetylase RimI-like enzyme